MEVVISAGMLGTAVGETLSKHAGPVALLGGLREPIGLDNARRWLRDRASYVPAAPPTRIRIWICGGRVGGAFDNQKHSYQYAVENMTYGLAALQVVEAALSLKPAEGVDVVAFGSTCQLPQRNVLCAEDQLNAGFSQLEPSNRGYALAKNAIFGALAELAPELRRAFWLNPCNLLGDNDPGLKPGNHDRAHAIPGMIHRAATNEDGTAAHPGNGRVARDFASAEWAAFTALQIVENVPLPRRDPDPNRAGRVRVYPKNMWLANLPPEYRDVPFSEVAEAINTAIGARATLGYKVPPPTGFAAEHKEYPGPPHKYTAVDPDTVASCKSAGFDTGRPLQSFRSRIQSMVDRYYEYRNS